MLAAGVIRVVIGFQLYPDNTPVTLADDTVIANARGQIVYSPPIRYLTPLGGGQAIKYTDLSRLSSIVVGIVSLDLESLRLLDATSVLAIANAFAVPANLTSPVQAWALTANTAVSLPSLASVPLPARQSVRVYERFYPVNPYGVQNP